MLSFLNLKSVKYSTLPFCFGFFFIDTFFANNKSKPVLGAKSITTNAKMDIKSTDIICTFFYNHLNIRSIIAYALKLRKLK